MRLRNALAAGRVGSFTIFTIGSVGNANDEQNICMKRLNSQYPQYDAIIFDKAFQINDADVVHVLFLSSPDKHQTEHIPMIFLGNPWQLSLHSVSSDCHGAQQSVSIFYRPFPEQSPGRAGQASCPYVMLNEQIRFNPTISELMDVITIQKVYNGKGLAWFRKVKYFDACSHYAEYNFTSTSQIPDEVWAYSVFVIHLNNNPRSHCQEKYMRSGRNKNNVHNLSRNEGLFVANLVSFLLRQEVYKPSQITNFTPYNTRCDAISKTFGMVSTSEVPCCNVGAQTVKCYQGNENRGTTFSARRQFTPQRARFSLGMSALEHVVHVAITRATHHLFILEDIQFLNLENDV